MPKPRQATPPTQGAPVPLKRKNSPGSGSSSTGRPPVAAKTSAHTGQHPSLRAKVSPDLPPLPQKDAPSVGYPALPPKSPELSSTSPPAVPKRQGVSKIICTMAVVNHNYILGGTCTNTCTHLVHTSFSPKNTSYMYMYSVH